MTIFQWIKLTTVTTTKNLILLFNTNNSIFITFLLELISFALRRRVNESWCIWLQHLIIFFGNFHLRRIKHSTCRGVQYRGKRVKSQQFYLFLSYCQNPNSTTTHPNVPKVGSTKKKGILIGFYTIEINLVFLFGSTQYHQVHSVQKGVYKIVF